MSQVAAPLRVLIFAVLLVALTAPACRERRSDDSGGAVAEDFQPPPPSLAEALGAANDAVETARILAWPVPVLPSHAMRGMALPLYSELPGLTYEAMLDGVADVGASHVSIVVSWNQRTIFDNRIAPDPDTVPSDERVEEVVRAARNLGLQSMLFPILHVELRNTGEWRGKLDPTEPQRWKQEYRAFILHYAVLAERGQVDILSVGSELSSMEQDTEFWTDLIADVRKAFSGKLLYSANWDHYETPTFWDQLDYVGVSSYFEVATRADEPIFAVTERWRGHRQRLLDFARSKERPLVLTEVGYPAIDSAAVKPWDYTARTAPNQGAQLAAFRSLADAWALPPETGGDFGGLFIWHAWGHGGPGDNSYPVKGKSTERLVQRWFAR